MSRFRPISVRNTLRDVPLSLLIGAGIGFILWLGDSEDQLWPRVVISAWIGLWIHLAVTAMLALASRLLPRLES